MADWHALEVWLHDVDQEIRITWSELQEMVGPLPPSASRHRAWWSGNRNHVRAWTGSGFLLERVELGQAVTFRRSEGATIADAVVQLSDGKETPQNPGALKVPDIVLVTCVKTKRSVPSAAKDLYTSPLFDKERAYAEAIGVPWFVLSAKHGLCQPDDWIAPYERYLPRTSREYQRAWGAFVVESLDHLSGPLLGKVVEVHASDHYVAAIRHFLVDKGAEVVTPLSGLSMGRRLQWYGAIALGDGPGDVDQSRTDERHADSDRFVPLLRDQSLAVGPHEFIAQDRPEWRSPGLYSWWVDAPGAVDLTRGLGHSLSPGLIYAGLAGATRWPSGKPSRNTLWSRIQGMHLGGRHEFSTFRRTLGSILAAANGWTTIDESQLTAWMYAHLRVVAIPAEDPDTLGRLESDMLAALDPPLNLQGRPKSEIRARLTELRRQHR